METHVIEVEKRDGRGKAAARKLRQSGRLPGILYGHKEEPVALSMDPKLFERHLRFSGKRRNTVLELSGLDRKVLALAKDIQSDPVDRALLHVDLLEVREGDRVVVEIPMVYHGRPEGVVKGGKLEGKKKTLRLECDALSIPKSIELTITKMQIGDTIRIEDLDLGEGVKPAIDPHQPVAMIKAPRAATDNQDEAEGAEAE